MTETDKPQDPTAAVQQQLQDNAVPLSADEDQLRSAHQINTSIDPDVDEIEIVVVQENIVRRGQIAFTPGDRIHATSIRELGISRDGRDLGDPNNAAQGIPSLPYASAVVGHHPEAVVDAMGKALAQEAQPTYAAAGEPVNASPADKPTEGTEPVQIQEQSGQVVEQPSETTGTTTEQPTQK